MALALPKPKADARAPATGVEIAELARLLPLARIRRGRFYPLLFALVAALAVGIAGLGLPSDGPRAWSPAVDPAMAIAGFSLAGVLAVVLITFEVRRFAPRRAIFQITQTVNVAKAPVVPIRTGDRFGPFEVVSNDANTIHLSRRSSHAWFQIRRLLWFTLGLAFIALGQATGSSFRTGGGPPALALLFQGFWTVVAAVLLFRAMRRDTHEWTIQTAPTPGPIKIVSHSLFRPASIVEIQTNDIVTFFQARGELSILTKGPRRFQLAGAANPLSARIDADPLSSWRSLCLASALALRLGKELAFTSFEITHGVSTRPLPAEIDSTLAVSPSTSSVDSSGDPPQPQSRKTGA